MVLILVYASGKAVEIVDPQNPTINQNTVPDFFTSREDYLSLKEINFKMAFTLYDMRDEKLLNDPRYIQRLPTISSKYQGEFETLHLGFHECTAAELASFNPVRRIYEQDLEVWTRRGLFCFDDLPAGAEIGGI